MLRLAVRFSKAAVGAREPAFPAHIARIGAARNVSDIKAAPALVQRAERMRYLLADKGYDADQLRRSLRGAGSGPVIPGRRNRKRTVRGDKDRYCGPPLIENAFCRPKDFRRAATRYDKLAANFLSCVALATDLAFWP